MGDEGWIKSATSLRYLREEVKRGDLFVCYEADRRQVVGLARAASDGRDVGMGSLVDFCPPREACPPTQCSSRPAYRAGSRWRISPTFAPFIRRRSCAR